MLALSVLLVGLACTTLKCGSLAIGLADFLDKQLASNKFEVASHFDNTLGYDNFTDNFYIQFKTVLGRNTDLVNVHYARKFFTDVRITSSITVDSPDATGDGSGSIRVPYNFALAQKSFIDWATLNDRWDMKVNSFGHQFIGLYHGTDPFVTNRMRSYMIRWLGNGIKDYLPILDATVKELQDDSEIVQLELNNVIRYIILRLHTKIKNLWSDMNYFDAHENEEKRRASAGGSMVVVSGVFIIVINMGEGRVIACDDTGTLVDLTAEHENRKNSLFIDDGLQDGPPFIRIWPKHLFNGADGDERKVKFILIESAAVAGTIGQGELSDIIKKESAEERPEPELYSAIVSRAIQLVADKMNAIEDKSSKLDHTILIAGLERRN